MNRTALGREDVDFGDRSAGGATEVTTACLTPGPATGSSPPADWDRLFALSVHPTQVEILAAIEWLELPVSPVQMTGVLDKHHKGIGHVGYHMRKLCEYRLLRLKYTRPVRGATEHFYLLAPRSRLD